MKEMNLMTSFFKKLFGKKAKEELRTGEEAGEDEAQAEETPSPAPQIQASATSTPAPSMASAPAGTGTIFTEYTGPSALKENDAAPRGKWRCSKCERLMDELVENCSFCGAAKDQ